MSVVTSCQQTRSLPAWRPVRLHDESRLSSTRQRGTLHPKSPCHRQQWLFETLTKSAEKPRHSCRGGIGVGRAGLNAQEPNKTHAVPEPSMGEGTAEREAPAFMPGRTSRSQRSQKSRYRLSLIKRCVPSLINTLSAIKKQLSVSQIKS